MANEISGSPEPGDDSRAKPPRVAEALLAATLPSGAIRESVLGDLHELFLARAGSSPAAEWRARIWYWRQALRLGGGYGLRRLRGARFRGFAPVSGRRPGDVRRVASPRAGMASLARDLRLALRALLRSPAFTLPVLAILAVGMTAATAIFTVVDSILFKPLDLPDAHRIVIVCEDHADLRGACVASPGNTEDFRREASTLAELGFGRGWPFHLADDQGSTGVRGGLATGAFFRALGARPAAGRLFTDGEVGPGRDEVVVLSHGLWSFRYGRDSGVIGRVVRLEGRPFEIVGVLPAGFEAPFDLDGIELWKPPHIDPLDPEVRGWRGFRAIGRLAPEASVAAAEAELGGLYRRLAQEHSEIDDTWRLRVESLQRVVVGDSRLPLLAFLGGAALLLAIVCANVANLVLAQGLARREELAVRAALGAARGRLVRLILVESLVLALLAAALAVLLSGGASRLVQALAPPDLPRLGDVATGIRVLAFALGAALAVTVTFALAPALRVTSWDLGGVLRAGTRSGEERSSGRFRSGLLVAELALATVLLATAGLLTRSFVAYLAWEPGFDRGSLLAVSAFADVGEHPTRAQYMDVFRRGEERVAAIPGVVSAATASAGPLFGGGDGATPFTTDPGRAGGTLPSVWWFDVGPGYFATLGVPLLQGREFTEADATGEEPVAVVNESMARLGWPGGDPVGRSLHLPDLELDLRIVGVVADVPPLDPGDETRPEVYWNNRQLGRPAPFVLVRTSVDPVSVAPLVTAALLEVDPGLSLGTPFPLTSSEARALVRPRFQALVMTSLAAVALLLSIVGVYGVISYRVTARMREMGIRRALGAGSGAVVGMVMRTSLAVAAAGVGAGVVGSLVVGHTLRGMIPGVATADPLTLTGAAVVLLAASALAALVPALRATHVDPLAAIRVD